jgi:hypothetical protein
MKPTQPIKGISMSSTPGFALSSSSSSSSSVSSSSGLAGSRSWALASALALALALLAAIVASPAHAARVAKAQAAAVRLTKVTVEDFELTIAGRVSLPPVSASTAGLRKAKSTTQRQHTEVYLTLTNGTGKTAVSEKFAVKLNSKDHFTVTRTTKLTGALGLDVLVKIDGRQSGKKIVKTLEVSVSGVSGAGSIGTGTGSSGSGTTPGAGTPGSPGSPGTTTPTGTTLNGTFELEAGAQTPSGLITGTYFRMKGIANTNSPFANQEYTPLSPGTDGGLETFAYQEQPNPPFAEYNSTTKEYSYNALAEEIVKPQEFLGVNFSIVTGPVDLQEGLADPLTEIVDTNGKLSGQITDWTAQWNGLSFNQGAPKSNGTLPSADGGEHPTTLPTGTYDAATGHYVLEWKSLIVGGPFNGQDGEWHLEGTFVPQA